VPSVVASLLAAGRVTVGVGVRPLGRLGRGGGQWLLKGSGISYKLPLIHGAASHYLKRNCLPLTQLPAGFNPGVVVAASVVCCGSRRRCVSVVVSSCVFVARGGAVGGGVCVVGLWVLARLGGLGGVLVLCCCVEVLVGLRVIKVGRR